MGGALDLLEVHSRLLDQLQKRSGSALSQSGRMGPPNYCGQRTAVYDGLHKKREGGYSTRDLQQVHYFIPKPSSFLFFQQAIDQPFPPHPGKSGSPAQRGTSHRALKCQTPTGALMVR